MNSARNFGPGYKVSELYHLCKRSTALWVERNSTNMTKWGSFLIPLAVSDRVILSSKTTNEREKNKLD